MITEPRAFLVTGDPVQQGSMTCKSKHAPGFKANVQPDNAKTLKPWRALVAGAARLHTPEKAGEYQPVSLVITYSLARPGYHYGTGRNADRVKPQYRKTLPTKQGTLDVDKLERAILDSLQASGTLLNDAQVVDVSHKKRFTLPDPPDRTVGGQPIIRPDWRDVLPVPGVVIRLLPIEEDDA